MHNLFVFLPIIPNLVFHAGKSSGGRGAIRVLRSQLPRSNNLFKLIDKVVEDDYASEDEDEYEERMLEEEKVIVERAELAAANLQAVVAEATNIKAAGNALFKDSKWSPAIAR